MHITIRRAFLASLFLVPGQAQAGVEGEWAYKTEEVVIARNAQLEGSNDAVMFWIRQHAKELRQSLVKMDVISREEGDGLLFERVRIMSSAQAAAAGLYIPARRQQQRLVFIPIVPRGTRWIDRDGRVIVGFQKLESTRIERVEQQDQIMMDGTHRTHTTGSASTTERAGPSQPLSDSLGQGDQPVFARETTLFLSSEAGVSGVLLAERTIPAATN